MLRSTAICLVLLRIAIGWHFLFEGLEKVRTRAIGPTDTNRPFSSAGYFREATGPIGGLMRGIVGDPYEETRALFALPKLPEGAKDKPYANLPPALERDWDDYTKRFIAFYQLDEEQQKKAATILQQAKSNAFTWLGWKSSKGPFANDADRKDKGVIKVKKTFPSGVVEAEETLPERVAEYNALLDHVRDTEAKKLWVFGKDVERDRLVKAKAELAQKRAALMKELAEKKTALENNLANVLTAEACQVGAQKTAETMECNKTPVSQVPPDRKKVLEQRGEVPELQGNRMLFWLDVLTALGLDRHGSVPGAGPADADQLCLAGRLLAADLFGHAALSLAAGAAEHRGQLFLRQQEPDRAAGPADTGNHAGRPLARPGCALASFVCP